MRPKPTLPVANKPTTASAEKSCDRMAVSSGGRDTDSLDDVAHITRRIPQRLARLRLPNPVHRPDLDLMIADRELHDRLPFAEGIIAEDLTELRRRPDLAA